MSDLPITRSYLLTTLKNFKAKILDTTFVPLTRIVSSITSANTDIPTTNAVLNSIKFTDITSQCSISIPNLDIAGKTSGGNAGFHVYQSDAMFVVRVAGSTLVDVAMGGNITFTVTFPSAISAVGGQSTIYSNTQVTGSVAMAEPKNSTTCQGWFINDSDKDWVIGNELQGVIPLYRLV